MHCSAWGVHVAAWTLDTGMQHCKVHVPGMSLSGMFCILRRKFNEHPHPQRIVAIRFWLCLNRL
jgi:hypothetical protein